MYRTYPLSYISSICWQLLAVLLVVQHPVDCAHGRLERIPLLEREHDALARRLHLAAVLVDIVLMLAKVWTAL